MVSDRSQALERSILATLAYFDVFDYPLRVEEVWRWLYVDATNGYEWVRMASPADVQRSLDVLVAMGKIERVGSYVMLPGRSETVAVRMSRKVAGERKWRRARLASALLRFVPFVKFVGVVNTLAIDNAKPESDIDFFIIVKQGRIWLTRAMVTMLVQAMGIRRHGWHVANRVCLSFFLSDGALNLERYALERDDPYLTFWATQIVSLFDRQGMGQRFRMANSWVEAKLPNGWSVNSSPQHGDLVMARLWRGAWEWLLSRWLGNALEQAARFLQLKLMERKSESRRLRPTTDVVVSDDILKFHERDRRQEYRQAFWERLVELRAG